jgi:hypothetical protein
MVPRRKKRMFTWNSVRFAKMVVNCCAATIVHLHTTLAVCSRPSQRYQMDVGIVLDVQYVSIIL